MKPEIRQFELVSIIIPTYNREENTHRAIESCLSQSYKNVQVIVVNDGGSVEKFDELRFKFHRDSRVEFYTISHTGNPGKVRDFALNVSKGEWVAFLDSDDYWDSEKLTVQMKIALNEKCAALCSNALITSTSFRLLPDSISEVLTVFDLLSTNSVINSSVLIRKELLLHCGGIAQSKNVVGAEDFATWLRISTVTSWRYLPQPLVFYELNSVDSFKYSKDVSQVFSRVYGLLDFIEWKKIQRGESLKLSRLFVELIPVIIKIDLFFSQARTKGKGSNLKG